MIIMPVIVPILPICIFASDTSFSFCCFFLIPDNTLCVLFFLFFRWVKCFIKINKHSFHLLNCFLCFRSFCCIISTERKGSGFNRGRIYFAAELYSLPFPSQRKHFLLLPHHFIECIQRYRTDKQHSAYPFWKFTR